MRTIVLLWESGRGWTIANGVLVGVQGVIPVIMLYVIKLIIDAVTESTQRSDPEIINRVMVLIAIGLTVALAGVLANSVAKVVKEAQAQLMNDRIYEMLHAKSIAVDLEYYDHPQYYNALHQAQAQAVYRPFNIMLELFAVAQYGVSLIAIMGLLISLHWVIAIVLLLAAVPGVFVRLKLADRQFRWMKKSTPTERRAGYMGQLLTQDIHAKEIRLFDLGSYFQDKFRSLRRQLRQERLAIMTTRSTQEFFVEAAGTLAVFGAFTFIAYRTLQGQISIGELVMYHQAFQRGQEFLERVMRNLAMLYEDNLFLSNLYTFLDLESRLVKAENPVPVPRPLRSGIELKQVSFRYPGSARQALDNVSLTIHPGEVIAVVGENGSGKTTLAKLLCRLYDPDQGSITFDGVDLRKFSISALRREISVIFQDYAKYHLSAQENIWFGDITLPIADEKVAQAAQRSGAHDVIARLPQRYDTILGKWFDEGEELSIGQWQKIALARAFLRESQLIILDEPTSAMDPKAEYEVFMKFRELLQNQAAILISHRLSTVKMADRIYVFEQGKLAESGTHDQLIRSAGIYAALFERQAEQYRL